MDLMVDIFNGETINTEVFPWLSPQQVVRVSTMSWLSFCQIIFGCLDTAESFMLVLQTAKNWLYESCDNDECDANITANYSKSFMNHDGSLLSELIFIQITCTIQNGWMGWSEEAGLMVQRSRKDGRDGGNRRDNVDKGTEGMERMEEME